MAIRRPRIKATANLMSIKRKVKTTTNEEQTKNEKPVIEKNVNNNETNKEESTKNEKTETVQIVVNNNNNESKKVEIEEINKNENSENLPNVEITPFEIEAAQPTEIPEEIHKNETNAFKEPPKYNNPNRTDVEENVLQIDMQKSSTGCPMSPGKVQKRARLYPSPVISQRRNSHVGFSPQTPSPDESSNEFVTPSPRRERFNSNSYIQASPNLIGSYSPAHSPHKYMPFMGARQRTESTCSSYSDMYGTGVVTKTRKVPTNEQNTRAQWRLDYESRCRNGVPDKSRLKMLDLIYYNPSTNPMELKVKIETKEQTNNVKIDMDEEKINNDEKNILPVPQLKLNANNELVLDDKSLEIETTAEVEARKILANSSIILVDENSGMNGFYKRQKRTRDWPHDETIKFYRCLQTVGTDFSLMVQLFPTRTRRELKLKFKKEERCNANLINKALLYPKIFDVQELTLQLQADEDALNEKKRIWQEIQMRQPTKIKKRNLKYSSADRTLQNGVDVYKNENIPKEYLSKRSKRAVPEAENVKVETIKSETKQMLKNHVEKLMAKCILQSVEAAEAENRDTENPKTKEKRKTKKVTKKNIKNEALSDSEDISKCLELEQNLTELLNNEEEHAKQITAAAAENNEEDCIIGKTYMNLDNGKKICILTESEMNYQDEHFGENISEYEEIVENNTTAKLTVDNQKNITSEMFTDMNNFNNEEIIATDMGQKSIQNDEVIGNNVTEIIDDNIESTLKFLSMENIGNNETNTTTNMENPADLENTSTFENFEINTTTSENIENNVQYLSKEIIEAITSTKGLENIIESISTENIQINTQSFTNQAIEASNVEIHTDNFSVEQIHMNTSVEPIENTYSVEQMEINSSNENIDQNISNKSNENSNSKENIEIHIETYDFENTETNSYNSNIQDNITMEDSMQSISNVETDTVDVANVLTETIEEIHRETSLTTKNMENNTVPYNFENTLQNYPIENMKSKTINVCIEKLGDCIQNIEAQTEIYTDINMETDSQISNEVNDKANSIDENPQKIYENEDEHYLDETNMEDILVQIENGSIMVVSSLDADNPQKPKHSIYMVDKENGIPSGEPLNLPADIVDALVELIS